MGKTNIDWVQMSDAAIMEQIGNYIRHERQQQQRTQAQLSEMAGLNRWTIGQIENGEAISLMSLLQILRALDRLHVLDSFAYSEEISPLAYAKLKKQQRQRIRNNRAQDPDKGDLGW
ncbi:transcriptional regulator, XRE family [Flagellimonas taeanensis]|uniref:Transcriptional regulator, XRE family n=2 Tax=Flagellimonas taeanensis TaxID=1005926 RepID=A0A1M6WCJ0_9FLAO|nr:transcriptional regulator, XRE family [Allomuricauda taeanensis]SHK91543.1 transcriptional regulator, XRE family [Allomuricauda taeanensis]